jgi:hypothetical protein
MSDILLRSYGVGDPPRIVKWYAKDRKGFESFMGQVVPDELACTMAITSLLNAVNNNVALFYMIDHGDQTIGFTGLTNITPSRDFGQPHIYIEPDSRRYSLQAARAAENHAVQIGIKHFMISVDYDNQRGLALVKKLGFNEVQRKAFLKELDV